MKFEFQDYFGDPSGIFIQVHANEFIGKTTNWGTTTDKFSYLHGWCSKLTSRKKFKIIALSALISTADSIIL